MEGCWSSLMLLSRPVFSFCTYWTFRFFILAKEDNLRRWEKWEFLLDSSLLILTLTRECWTSCFHAIHMDSANGRAFGCRVIICRRVGALWSLRCCRLRFVRPIVVMVVFVVVPQRRSHTQHGPLLRIEVENEGCNSWGVAS